MFDPVCYTIFQMAQYSGSIPRRGTVGAFDEVPSLGPLSEGAVCPQGQTGGVCCPQK